MAAALHVHYSSSSELTILMAMCLATHVENTNGHANAEGGVPYTRPSRIYVGLTARFTLGSTPVLRFGFVGFASGLVGIRTGLVRISGFVPDFVPKSNGSPLGATWGLFWPF